MLYSSPSASNGRARLVARRRWRRQQSKNFDNGSSSLIRFEKQSSRREQQQQLQLNISCRSSCLLLRCFHALNVSILYFNRGAASDTQSASALFKLKTATAARVCYGVNLRERSKPFEIEALIDSVSLQSCEVSSIRSGYRIEVSSVTLSRR